MIYVPNLPLRFRDPARASDMPHSRRMQLAVSAPFRVGNRAAAKLLAACHSRFAKSALFLADLTPAGRKNESEDRTRPLRQQLAGADPLSLSAYV